MLHTSPCERVRVEMCAVLMELASSDRIICTQLGRYADQRAFLQSARLSLRRGNATDEQTDLLVQAARLGTHQRRDPTHI
jgi:hypothetical protein